ncbi:hypothetical protein L6227_17685 [Pseudomonas syringae pv. syringae]|uniref:hypothetical protein n=1 Tax=Pseudomonas syringae TaxID=317 RepID=UPI001F11657D|nr:hypothetical protein [Pseudomonas syringae]MCH5551111.1 hypothetical protein [Pseudomonas syringae pv. syringae]
MDTIESLGSTEYATTRALIRIDAIGTADTPALLIYRLAAASAYITAAAELKVITENAWAELLELADRTYNAHHLAVDTADSFDP